MKIKLILTAKNQFIETSTQSVDNTKFLILRFLHIKYNKRRTSKNE